MAPSEIRKTRFTRSRTLDRARTSPLSTSRHQLGKSWQALFGIFFVQQMRPDVRRAEAVASELIARAEERGADGLVAEAGNWLAYTKMVAG